MKDIVHYEKDLQVQRHHKEQMRNAEQWRLAKAASSQPARRYLLSAFIGRMLAALRLWLQRQKRTKTEPIPTWKQPAHNQPYHSEQ